MKIMALINKDKFLNGMGKAVDGVNSTAEHVDKFIKDKQIDQKISSAINKTEGFIKDNEIDKKINSAVNKTEDFIKDNQLDKKAQKAVNTLGRGIKAAGEKMENAFDKNKTN